ncbi:O-methyltransferase [Marmoricola sp. URHA0025 HA25]
MPETQSRAAELYLQLLKRVLTGAAFEDGDQVLGVNTATPTNLKGRAARTVTSILDRGGLEIARKRPYDPDLREDGRDWPARALSMIGNRRMDNLQYCVERVLLEGIPGDLIETGVWRGGATIFMRAILKAHAITDRTVWVADSFEGLPRPDPHRYPSDAGDRFFTQDALRVGVEQVRANFRRYDLLDDQVRFLVGWFADTLPTAPIEQLAVLRLDGDMYSSTIQAIEALYPRLSPGGYCIVDDYGAVEGCRQAISDYRAEHKITDPIEQIDWTGVFWRKS